MTFSAYKTYKTSARQNMSAPEATALLLEEASKNMQAACRAIEAGDIETRFKESEKASLILGNLEKALVRLDTTQSKTADSLKDYYDDTISLITRMNINNDHASANSIANSLGKMATEFRKVSVLHEKQLQEDATPVSTQEGLKVRA